MCALLCSITSLHFVVITSSLRFKIPVSPENLNNSFSLMTSSCHLPSFPSQESRRSSVLDSRCIKISDQAPGFSDELPHTYGRHGVPMEYQTSSSVQSGLSCRTLICEGPAFDCRNPNWCFGIRKRSAISYAFSNSSCTPSWVLVPVRPPSELPYRS